LTTEKQLEKGISDIVGVFTDPIIVYPGGGWENDLPEWIKPAITLERLVMNVKGLTGEKMTATDAEALAYLYPACLSFPFDHDWTQIYLYLGYTVMSRHNPFGKESTFPNDIKVDKLTPDQERDLTRLKEWIYKKRVEARLERGRAERRERKEEKAKLKEELQPALFDL